MRNNFVLPIWHSYLAKWPPLMQRGRALLPGLGFCLLLVVSAHFLLEHYHFPVVLGALLLGIVFNQIAFHEEFSPGIDFCARHVMRMGIALLGLRLSFSQIVELGSTPLLIVTLGVTLTLLFSLFLALRLGLTRVTGIVAGAAVGICGVSAAMAVATVLSDQKSESQKHLIHTIVGVTALSSLCMFLYPALLLWLDLSEQQMGMFLGASIHDVAQVFGAGAMISTEVAQLAIYTKMLRVALLVPIVFLLAHFGRENHPNAIPTKLPVPVFLVAFIGFVLVVNVTAVPRQWVLSLSDFSQVCLWLAMAALGTKIQLMDLLQVGGKPILLLLLNTVFLALVSFVLIYFSV